MKEGIEELLHHVREHALLVPEPDRMLFKLEGRDALDLLHRISTNDLLNGPPVRTVRTLFCTEKGRVIDVAEIVFTGKELFMILTASSTDRLLAWIEKFTITEDITISPLTTDFTTYLLIGPEAIPVAQSLELIGAEGVHPQTESVHPQAGTVHPPIFSAGRFAPFLAWRSTFGGTRCVRIAAGRTSELPTILRGKAVSVSREDAPDVYGMLRAIYLVPETGHEIIDAYNPMEIGLSDEISFTKGCYIGQEVIARLDSYKKVQRRLCLLSSSKALRPAMASPVQYQGTGVGTVTTSASSQKRSIALAVIRIEAFEEHETLQINSWDFSIYKGSYPAYSLIDSGRGKPE